MSAREPSLDANRTVDHVVSSAHPETVDVARPDQPTDVNGRRAPAPPVDAPTIPG